MKEYPLKQDRTVKVVIKKNQPYGSIFNFYVNDELILPGSLQVTQDDENAVIFEFGNPSNPLDFLIDTLSGKVYEK